MCSAEQNRTGEHHDATTRCRGAGRTRPHGANLGEPSRDDGGDPRLLAGPGGRRLGLGPRTRTRRGGVLPALPRPLGRRLGLHPETLSARGREGRREPRESPRSSVLGGCAAGGGWGRRGLAATSGLEIGLLSRMAGFLCDCVCGFLGGFWVPRRGRINKGGPARRAAHLQIPRCLSYVGPH